MARRILSFSPNSSNDFILKYLPIYFINWATPYQQQGLPLLDFLYIQRIYIGFLLLETHFAVQCVGGYTCWFGCKPYLI